MPEVPYQVGQTLAHLLGELNDAGFVPEEFEEEVVNALESWKLWHEEALSES